MVLEFNNTLARGSSGVEADARCTSDRRVEWTPQGKALTATNSSRAGTGPSLFPESFSEGSLLQFRHPVDDTERHVVARLDLDHFDGETFTQLLDVPYAELQLTAAPFDQMTEQQDRQVLDSLVSGVVVQVEDSWDGRGST